MNVYKFLLLVLALAVTPDPSAAEVQNVTYCDPQVADGPSWEVDHTLPLFDPSLGDLIGVNLTANLELFQNYSAENLGVAPQNVDLNYSVELVVTTPGTGLISVAASVLIREELAGFDGKQDYSGPSGMTIAYVTNSSKTQEYVSPSGFVATVPGETIVLSASVSHIGGGMSVPGNFISMAKEAVLSEVCVTYTYEPTVPGEGGISG